MESDQMEYVLEYLLSDGDDGGEGETNTPKTISSGEHLRQIVCETFGFDEYLYKKLYDWGMDVESLSLIRDEDINDLFPVTKMGLRVKFKARLAQWRSNDIMELPEVDGDHFNYFGYGSNLLAARIHIENESAVRKAVGKLKDYRLDFYTYTKRWNGAPATIVPTNNSVVYGAVWSINLKDLADLDRQEGVHSNTYAPMSVPVETAEGIIMCRAYFLTSQPSTIIPQGEEAPYDRQPSKTYLKTLVKGAIETKIPETYLNWMKNIKHNGNLVENFEKQLELESVELSS